MPLYELTFLVVICSYVSATVPAKSVDAQLDLYGPFQGGEYDFDDVVSVAAVAIHHANEGNGSITPVLSDPVMTQCPYKFNYKIRNTCSNPDDGDSCHDPVQAMTNLIQTSENKELPDVIIGPLASSVAVHLSVVAKVYTVGLISPSATSTDLSNRKESSGHPYFFSTIASDKSAAFYICAYLNQIYIEVVGMIYGENNYGRGFKDEMIVSCNEFNITVNSYAVFDVQSQTVALDKIQDDNLNVVMTVALVSVPELAMSAFKKGMTGAGKLWIYVDDVKMNDPDELKAHPELAQVYNGSIQIVPAGGLPGNAAFDSFQLTSRTWDTYIADINKNRGPQTKELPANYFSKKGTLSFFSTFAYDAAVSAVYALCENYAQTGILDVYNKTGRVNGSAFKARLESDDFQFEGVTGKLKIDEVGRRDVSTANSKLINFQIDDDLNITTVEAGVWNNTKLTWDLDSILYPGGLSQPPVWTDIPTPELNTIETWARAFIYTMATIVYILSFGCLFWIFVNRENIVLKASQPMFLNALILGVLVSTSAVFPLSYDKAFNYENVDNVVGDGDFKFLDGSCMASWWLWSLGTTITSSALVCKLYRIMKIFNKKLKRVRITAMHMLKVLGGLVLINVALLLSWQLTDPLVYKLTNVTVDQYGYIYEEYGLCETVDGGAAPLLVVILVFHLLIYVYGVYCGWKTRNAPPDLQEGKWISVALISQVQLLVLGIPIVTTIEGDPQTLFIILSLIILLINLVLVLFMFGPKIYRLRYGEKGVVTHRPNNRTVQTMNTSRTKSEKTSKNLSGMSGGEDSDGMGMLEETPDEITVA